MNEKQKQPQFDPAVESAHGMLDRYRSGRQTDTEFIIDVLRLNDRRTIKAVLAIIPPALLDRLEDFVREYTPGTRVFNGPGPEIETVQLVKGILLTDIEHDRAGFLGRLPKIPQSADARQATRA